VEERGRLIFYDDCLMLHYREQDQWLTKCISPTAVRCAFSQELLDTGWMPSGVRRWGMTSRGDWVVLFIPPVQHRFWLQKPGQEDERPETKLQLMELMLPMPALVFMGFGMSYYIWAVTEAELQPNALTYHAPLPNIDEEGRICLGANNYPLASCEKIGEAWHLFLDSPFNDHHADRKSQRYPDDIRRRWLNLKRHPRDTYPLNDLVSRRRTVEQAVKQVLEGRPL
jgi:PRTRC genetic system protein B